MCPKAQLSPVRREVENQTSPPSTASLPAARQLLGPLARLAPQPHLLLLRSLLGAPFSHAYGAAEDFPWVLLLALLLFSCVTLGKLLDVPEPQLSHL